MSTATIDPCNLTGPDPGYMVIQTPTGEARIDVYEANNKIVAAQSTAENESALDKNAALVATLATLGLPGLSHYLAGKVADAIATRADELAKNGEQPGVDAETPGLPASTAPESPF